MKLSDDARERYKRNQKLTNFVKCTTVFVNRNTPRIVGHYIIISNCAECEADDTAYNRCTNQFIGK